MTWSIAPSISWTIFNGGQRLNAVKLQRAQLMRQSIGSTIRC